MFVLTAEIPQQSIRYIVDPANSHKSMACLTPQQLELLALKEEALTYIHPISATCYDISRLPGVVLNNSAGVLDITVPQAWMKYTDPDWTPPERWDNGVAGLIFDYSVSGQATHYEQGGDHYRSLSGYGQTGFNLGAWRFRGQYQANYASDENRGRIDWDQIYAYRPLPMQAAKLTVGEIYLNSRCLIQCDLPGLTSPATSACYHRICRATRPKCTASPAVMRRSPSVSKGVLSIKPPFLRGHLIFRIYTARYAARWMFASKSRMAAYKPFRSIRPISLI